MTEDELKISQDKDWQNYRTNRIETRIQLYRDHIDLLSGCTAMTERGQSLIEDVLDDQVKSWWENDKDERDALRHAHTHEWETLRNRQKCQQDKERDR